MEKCRLNQIKNESIVNIIGILLIGFGLVLYLPLFECFGGGILVVSIYFSIKANGWANTPERIMKYIGLVGMVLFVFFRLFT